MRRVFVRTSRGRLCASRHGPLLPSPPLDAPPSGPRWRIERHYGQVIYFYNTNLTFPKFGGEKLAICTVSWSKLPIHDECASRTPHIARHTGDFQDN